MLLPSHAGVLSILLNSGIIVSADSLELGLWLLVQAFVLAMFVLVFCYLFHVCLCVCCVCVRVRLCP